MKIVNTNTWLLKPDMNRHFRIESNIYRCIFKLGCFALIKPCGTILGGQIWKY